MLLLLLAIAAGCQVADSLNNVYWQKRLERALGPDMAPKDDGLCPTNSPIRLQWEARAKTATVGMSRAEVEKILPFYDFPEHGPHPYLGRVVVNNLPGNKDWVYRWYYVAPDFIAVFFYDKTEPLDRLGEGPNQRLVRDPEIIHHDFTWSPSNSMLGGAPAKP